MTQNGISPHVCVEVWKEEVIFCFGSYLSQKLMDFASIWVILKAKSCWATISEYIRNPNMKLNEYGISEYAKNPYLLDALVEGVKLDPSTIFRRGESEIKLDSDSEFMASWVGLGRGRSLPSPFLMTDRTTPPQTQSVEIWTTYYRDFKSILPVLSRLLSQNQWQALKQLKSVPQSSFGAVLGLDGSNSNSQTRQVKNSTANS